MLARVGAEVSVGVGAKVGPSVSVGVDDRAGAGVGVGVSVGVGAGVGIGKRACCKKEHRHDCCTGSILTKKRKKGSTLDTIASKKTESYSSNCRQICRGPIVA